jgi:hypothetical protein
VREALAIVVLVAILGFLLSVGTHRGENLRTHLILLALTAGFFLSIDVLLS